MELNPPIPSQRLNDSAIDPSAGTHTKARCSADGTPTIRASTSLSRRVRLLSERPRLRVGVPPAGAAFSSMAMQPTLPRQPTKIACFCFSIDDSRLLVALGVGFLMKLCDDGIITVETKSGRLSRS